MSRTENFFRSNPIRFCREAGLWLLSFLCYLAAPSTLWAIEETKDHASEEEASQIADSVRTQFAELFRKMSPEAKRGYANLLANVYLPSDFDEEVVRQLDSAAEVALPLSDYPVPTNSSERFIARYGLSPRPGEEKSGRPLQYVVTSTGSYVMNCFACHGGNLHGASYPGAPNTLYQLASLTEDVRRSKIQLGKKLTHMDVGSVFMPLGESVGTSNAVMFGVALMNYRDADLNIHIDRAPASMLHHDMDAPPWWHFYRKSHIYLDGFAEKGHRGLMQFMLVKQNGPKQFQRWEEDFRDIYAFLEELRPPKYPLPIDLERADRGKLVFETNCASCHGTYGANSAYPEVRVPVDDVQTDPVRWQSLSAHHRKLYADSWFAHYGTQETHVEAEGYVAPPLDGVWASAPYLHNGSVPTLWHLLNPEARPKVWKRTALALDTEKMGLTIEELDAVPTRLPPYQRRLYFNSQIKGKSSQGHDYPNVLTEEEKRDVLEYLKTL